MYRIINLISLEELEKNYQLLLQDYVGHEDKVNNSDEFIEFLTKKRSEIIEDILLIDQAIENYHD